jgi:hypothetical protein
MKPTSNGSRQTMAQGLLDLFGPVEILTDDEERFLAYVHEAEWKVGA